MNYSILTDYELPARHCVELKKPSHSVKYNSIKDISDNSKMKGEQKPLVDAMVNELTYHHLGSEAEEPTVSLVFHDKRDGIVAAKGVYDRITDDVPEAVLNPDFDDKKLSSFIKPASIKRAAIEQEIWNGKEDYSIKDFKKSAISVIAAIISLVFTFFDLTGIFNFTINFAGNEHALTAVFCAITLLCTVFAFVSFILVRREHVAKDLDAFEKMIAADEDDTRFMKLINSLEAEDFTAFSYGSKDCVYVVNLSESAVYTPRKRKALQRYLSVMNGKQCWFVFLEAIHESEPMLSLTNVKIFTLVKLGIKKKRALAQQVYTKTGKFIYDSMLGHYGIDAIFGGLLDVGTTAEDKALLEKKVDEFAAKYSEYNIRVKRLVYFVADLSQKYRINFENPTLWKYLFKYNGEAPAIENIDKRLVREIFFKDVELVKDGHYNQIERIIVDICIFFGGLFSDLSENNPYADKEGGEYVQLCLIKAMRVRKQDDEYRLSTVATIILDNIYDLYRLVYYDGEYGALCDFSSGEWGSVILYALSVFESENYRWFSPEIVHAFLMLYGAADAKSRPVGVVSAPAFLTAARSNLLLGPNIHGGESGDTSLQVSFDGMQREIDPVHDHYLTVKYAVSELNLSEKSTFGNTPACFDIIRMTAGERDEYYIALSRLEEKSVIDFFENLYDTFSACSSAQRTIKFCSRSLYQNKIEAKYSLGDKKYESDLSYVAAILDKMFVILRGVYAEDARILARLTELHEMYRSDEDDIDERLLLELAESEFVGISVFSYLICMAARIKGKQQILENMYLGIGNYLVRFIFLIYHETAVNSLNNSDFKHMALILDSYDEPGEAVLGYICWCSAQVKPSEVGGIVNRYLGSHTDRCVANLEAVAESLNVGDFEDFISYLFSAGYLTEEQKNGILSKIIGILRSKFTYGNQVAMCIELATVLSENRMSEEFAALDNDGLVARIEAATANSCYILLRKYVRIDAERFYPLCERLMTKLLVSTIVGKKELIIEYFYHVMQNVEQRDVFVNTLFRVMGFWNSSLNAGYKLSHSSASAAMFVRFFRSCLALEYVPDSMKTSIELALKATLDEHSLFLELETNEKFFLRSWEKLSIVNLLIYILELSALSRANSRWADGLSAEERKAEITASAYDVRPLINIEGEYFVNGKYLDVLRAISKNDSDVQSLIDEEAIIHKLLSDALQIVEYVFEDAVGRRVKAKLTRISAAYRRF